MIEIYEPGSPNERMMMALLAQSKRWLEENRPVHVAAFASEKTIDFMPLDQLGDWNDSNVREHASRFLRKLAKDLEATFYAFISDTYVTKLKGAPEEMKAAGLEPHEYKKWPKEAQERFGMTRREALLMLLEPKGSPCRALYQFYRRKDGAIIWEEFETDTSGCFGGRFFNIFGGPRS